MTKRRKPSQTNQTAAIVYARVSALESQAETELSLDNQERTLRAAATAAGYAQVTVIRERHTASKTQPELERVLNLLATGAAGALFVDKVDRLTRTGMADAIRVADQADRHGWRLVILDLAGGTVDTGSAAGRILLGIMAEIARQESIRRSERMVAYHAERWARGDRAGCTYGRRNSTRQETADRIRTLHGCGESYAAIARTLDAESVDGRRWHAQTVRRVILAA